MRWMLALALALLPLAGGRAEDLVTPDRFIADPSAHVFDGRVYLYTTDDSGNDGRYWNGRDWRLYSSDDMAAWRDHGAIFSIDGFAWARELAWAPTAVEKDGRYYLFLPVDRTKIGVAVASSPTGPFHDLIGSPLIDNARDANAGPEPIDPAITIDDQGDPWLYFGTRVPKVVKLSRDLKHLAGPIRDLAITGATVPYGEAPWIHRHAGLYYFSYSTGWPGQIAYATAATPDGPFTARGIILDRVNTFTNHQAIIEKDGRSWLFFHEAALPGGGEFRRSVAVAPLTYRADGSIEAVQRTGLSAYAAQPWLDRTRSPDARADAAVAAMTQAEKLSLVFGYASGEQATTGFPTPDGAYPGSAGIVPGIPRLGLPPLWESDSGIGVSGVGPAAEQRQRTALPSALAVAASWDTALAERGGAMIGAQARASGYNVLLAGSSMLVREPRSGRNFESGGEDPLLNGIMTGAAIRGVQSAGVISTLKHFAVNVQETGREVVDARIAEDQARMSDYLAAQIAIEQGRPGSVMCAYNRVNGVYSCENPALLGGMLKGDWSYKGYVMSDWGAVHSTVASANAGFDQQSGWPFDKERYFGPPLAAAIADGTVPAARLDDMVRRIVRAMAVSRAIDDPVKPGGTIDFATDQKVSQSAAEAGIVLLKNDRDLLPLAANAGSIAVIGGHADRGVLSGGGSAQVHPVGGNAVPGIDPTGWPGPVVYDPAPPFAALARRFGDRVRFDAGGDVAKAAALARSSDIAVVFVTQWTTESRDTSLTLPDGQDALVAAIVAANPRTIVVIESGGAVLMPWADRVPAIVAAWFPGSAGGEAIARVLTGEVDATGRLPISFPRSLSDLPRPVLDGIDLAPGTPFAVDYHEGAAVGYKWDAIRNQTPLFAFGHGLSYTAFALSDLKVRASGSDVTIDVTVRNTGKRAGSETVQIYASPVNGGWEAPRRLIGFAKVLLEPGKDQTVSLAIDPRLLATWYAPGHCWQIDGGAYRFEAGHASDDRPLGTTQMLAATTLPASYVSPTALSER